MRLGVVLTGAGACAAASAGALTWLLDAGVSPCAVCGMQAAAWPAALYLAGYDAGRLRGAAAQAARMGRRLLRADASASAVLGMKKSALCRGRRLEKLLAAQTGERALGLCERQGVFLCRTARSGHVVAFCTQSVSQEGTIVTLQASAGFAARAGSAAERNGCAGAPAARRADRPLRLHPRRLLLPRPLRSCGGRHTRRRPRRRQRSADRR